METKDTIILRCIADLVEHNKEMVKFCEEENQSETLSNYYEGKFDAYTRVYDLLKDAEDIYND